MLKRFITLTFLFCVLLYGGPARSGPFSGATGQVPGVTYNSTGAAAVNASNINAALAQGGHVILDCPQNGIIWINASMKVFSNTKLEIYPNCTIKAAAGTGALIINNASNSAWTTLWNGTGLITSAPFSVIDQGFVGAWTTSHTYAAGTYIFANSNMYWTSAGGTSLGSGTGPSGTGTGISDGTISWNYVTTQVPIYYANPDAYSLATILWTGHGLVKGQSIWISPQPDGNSTSNQIWTGTQAAGQQGGLADSAYFGVFQIVAVNDANSFTVALRRDPAIQFSGIPMNIKVADQNITISGGGILDYNGGTNGYITGHPESANNLTMAGVYGLTMDSMGGQSNNSAYIFELAGVSMANVRNLFVGPVATQKDILKVYGPAFDVHVHDIAGTTSNTSAQLGDDIVTLQTEEANFAGAQFVILGAGDVLGVNVENISSNIGHLLGIYLSNTNLYMDNIEFSHVSPNFPAPVQITGYAGLGGTIGTVNVHDISMRSQGQSEVGGGGNDAVVNLVCYSGCGTDTIESINLENININSNNAAISTHLFADNTNGSFTVKNITARAITGNLYTSLFYHHAGAIGNIGLNNSEFDMQSSVNSELLNVDSGSATLGNFHADGNYILGTPPWLIQNLAASNISLTNNSAPNMTSAVIEGRAAQTVYVAGNNFPALTLGLVRFNANSAETVSSGGGNNFNGAAFTNGSGTGTVKMYGWDLQCDVTKLTRTTGEYCFNTNTAPGSGTLNTAGLVADQGTSSNSWFLLANPTGQQY